MALWQYEVLLVPRSKLLRTFGRVPGSIAEELIDTVNEWDGYSLTEEDRRLLTTDALPRESWHREILMWGEDDGNRIHVVLEAGAVAEVSARIDLRAVDPKFLRGLAEIASHWDCMFITNDLEVAPPLLVELEAVIGSSPARRFVDDPQGFFDSYEPRWEV